MCVSSSMREEGSLNDSMAPAAAAIKRNSHFIRWGQRSEMSHLPQAESPLNQSGQPELYDDWSTKKGHDWMTVDLESVRWRLKLLPEAEGREAEKKESTSRR